MTRINKTQAANIAGIHEKTLERMFHDLEFCAATDYHKAVNKRVSFDEQKFREYAAKNFGIDEPETLVENVGIVQTFTDAAEIVETPKTAIVKKKRVAKTKNTDISEFAKFTDALILPHKIFLTVKEAAKLSGLTQKMILPMVQKIGGRNLIRRALLLDFCAELAEVQKGNVGKGNVGKKGKVEK